MATNAPTLPASAGWVCWSRPRGSSKDPVYNRLPNTFTLATIEQGARFAWSQGRSSQMQDVAFQSWRNERDAVEAEMNVLLQAGLTISPEDRRVRAMRFIALV